MEGLTQNQKDILLTACVNASNDIKDSIKNSAREIDIDMAMITQYTQDYNDLQAVLTILTLNGAVRK